MPPGGFTTSQVYGSYSVICGPVLCCYEHLLTFDAELKHVWRRHLSAGSVLFVLNRYAILVASLASIAQVIPWLVDDMLHLHTSSLACSISLRIADICILVVYLSYTIFAALRMYALYGKSKAALILVLSVAIMGPCAQSYFLASDFSEVLTKAFIEPSSAVRQEHLNCYVQFREVGFFGQVSSNAAASGAGGHIYIPIAVRLHSLLVEILLLGMTWNKSFTRSNLRAPEFCAPTTTVLLRDGTLYFMVTAVIIGLNLGGLVLSMRRIGGDTAPSSVVFGLVLFKLGPMVDTITSICMSRFLLNLLAAADDNYDTQYCSSRWDTILRFAQVETFGAPLRDTLDEDSDEDGVENISPLGDFDIMRANERSCTTLVVAQRTQ